MYQFIELNISGNIFFKNCEDYNVLYAVCLYIYGLNNNLKNINLTQGVGLLKQILLFNLVFKGHKRR